MALGLACASLEAQTTPGGRDARAGSTGTLALWADEVWLALTDRDGAYFGRLADQGTFQRFNPLMDAEYELDLLTGLFSASEDERWTAASEGLRVSGASINHPFILNFVDWREEVPVSGPVDLFVRYRRQRSLTTQRDYPMVGIAWRKAPEGPWTLQSSIGMHFFKSSADVELALARSWGRSESHRFSVDLRLAMLDAFNNVIFNALGVRPEETPAHFDYTTLPMAARVAFAASSRMGRVELHGGVTTRSEVAVTFPSSGDPPYALSERVSFAGGLVEVALSRRVVLALLGTTARAATDRRFASPSRDDLRLRERTSAVGFRGRLRARQTLSWELDLSTRWRPEDRLRGDGETVRHQDREVFGQLALARRPPAGWAWRLGYAFMDREAGVLAPQLSAINHRQLMEGGYVFRSGFDVMAGLRWDLDRGLAAPFDGGHLRFAAAW